MQTTTAATTEQPPPTAESDIMVGDDRAWRRRYIPGEAR